MPQRDMTAQEEYRCLHRAVLLCEAQYGSAGPTFGDPESWRRYVEKLKQMRADAMKRMSASSKLGDAIKGIL